MNYSIFLKGAFVTSFTLFLISLALGFIPTEMLGLLSIGLALGLVLGWK